MPPAFNLSQDQTLQFDLLKLTQKNQSELHFSSRERLWTPKDPAHPPSNAHAYRLSVVKELCYTRRIRLASHAAHQQRKTVILLRFSNPCQALGLFNPPQFLSKPANPYYPPETPRSSEPAASAAKRRDCSNTFAEPQGVSENFLQGRKTAFDIGSEAGQGRIHPVLSRCCSAGRSSPAD